ncbi:hypothetical protein ES705_15564 [subsurface metagenome]
MALERASIMLEAGTIKELKEISKKIDNFYSVSASDLIRFALHEVYGVEFSSSHTWESNLRESIKKIREVEE